MTAMPNFHRIEQAAARVDEAIAVAEGAQNTSKVLSSNEEHLLGDLSTFAEVIIQNGASISPKAIRWLWQYWLALGKLHILAGAPGQGKTTLVLAAIATLTCGGRWPDGSRCDPGNVLIWSGEDDPDDTLVPRLMAMGADMRRVNFVKGTMVRGEVLPFDPARDLVQLTAAAERIGDIKLVMVDPVVSAVAGDSHKNTEVRRALQPLVDLASHLDAAVVGISHFAKGGAGRDPTERVVGSVAFSAVARVVLVAAKVKSDDGEDRRLLARSKSNIGPDDGAFEYCIEQVELDAHPGVYASRVEWGQAVAGTARELLAEAEADDPGSAKSAKVAAAEWLEELLAMCAVSSTQVKTDAKDAGYSWATVRRAADDLGVVRKKAGMDAGWYWSLPKVLTKNPKALIEIDEHLPQTLSTFDAEEEL